MMEIKECKVKLVLQSRLASSGCYGPIAMLLNRWREFCQRGNYLKKRV